MSFMGGAVLVAQSDCGSAGGAMYDPPSHDPNLMPHGPHCWMMNAPPIIIGDTYMSIMEGFQQVNIAFNTWGGGKKSVPDPSSLPGPAV